MAGLSQREFARRAGVAQQSVLNAAHEGRLQVEAGKLDPEHPLNAGFIASHRAGNGAVGTEAKLGVLTTKARWLTERLQRVEAAHVERAAIAEGIRQTLDMLCAAAPLIPHRYRRVVAARLRIDEDVAGALLQDVAELLLAETAELPEQGHAAATRLS
jgi:hypothetical protein